MSAVLQQILATKRGELAELRRQRLPAPPPLRPVALGRAPGRPLGLITEIKLRSPSAGALSRVLGVAERARAYEQGGSSMLSVLCDATYFDGSYAHLAQARAACSLPVLCKEFIVDEVQLDAARAHGADAVLLIVRCLEPGRVGQLLRAAAERGLAVLTEVHAPEEVPVALDAGAQLIGVNARDLDTLVLDAARAERILAELPAGVTRVHLSGIRDEAQIRACARSGADAALIGECLMRQDDPVPLLRRLVAAAG
jgi:indole-3-glycerol phosphate synthase